MPPNAAALVAVAASTFFDWLALASASLATAVHPVRATAAMARIDRLTTLRFLDKVLLL
jgi:hypothetical protein